MLKEDLDAIQVLVDEPNSIAKQGACLYHKQPPDGLKKWPSVRFCSVQFEKKGTRGPRLYRVTRLHKVYTAW